MKKIALLAVAFSLSASSLFAQDGGAAANGSDKNFHFGLNITPGLYFPTVSSSTTTGNTTYSNTANNAGFGFGYGLNLEFYFASNYGLATGIEVTQFAANYTSLATTTSPKPGGGTITDSSNNNVHQQSVQYLDIPILLKLRTNPIGPIKYFGQFGLGAGFLLNATDNQTVTRTVYATSFPAVTTNDVNVYSKSSFFRLSLVVGAGMEYNLSGPASIQASINYDNAFTSVNHDGTGNLVLMKGVNLTIGFLF